MDAHLGELVHYVGMGEDGTSACQPGWVAGSTGEGLHLFVLNAWQHYAGYRDEVPPESGPTPRRGTWHRPSECSAVG